MESFDCAEDDVVVECNDSDGDCISDDEDANDGNDRENGGDQTLMAFLMRMNIQTVSVRITVKTAILRYS